MRASIRLGLVLVVGCSTDPEPLPTHPWNGKPVSGGTIAISPDGSKAAVADPDRDRIYLADLNGRSVEANLELEANDEPGRVVWDAAGRFHVALRQGGAVVTVEDGAISSRRGVCAEPRALAWEEATDSVHVACASGELVTLPASGGGATRVLRLGRDLRDVLVTANGLIVTRFRTAEIMLLDGNGAVVEQARPPAVPRRTFDFVTGTELLVDATPAVAWRAVSRPDGTIVLAHQRRLDKALSISDGGYGGDCGGMIEATASTYAPGQNPVAGRSLIFGALPVDLAVSPDGGQVAFALAGDASIRVVPASILSGGETGPCDQPLPPPPAGGGDQGGPVAESWIPVGRGIPTSVAFRQDGDLVAFYPEDPSLVILDPQSLAPKARIEMPGGFAVDESRSIFHTATFANLACASCHPEGRDDAQVWEFNELGLRRTQSIAGGILQRAPYHWNGDMTNLGTLLEEVLVRRMGGTPVFPEQLTPFGEWLDRIPAPAPPEPLDLDAVARGEALFTSEEVGCATCHQGPLFTTNELVDVGTGGIFKVPSLLGVSGRAPFLHDGSAATLRDRFNGAGDLHGVTSILTEQDKLDLVAYLETL